MADLTLTPVGGAPVGVISGTIALPRVGRWMADLVLDHDQAVRGRVTLASVDGSFSLKGAIVRGGVELEVGHVRVVGGAGGLETEVPPVYYRSVELGLPLRALLAAAGEALSPTAEAGALSMFLVRWVRPRGIVADALARLVDAAGAAWRMADDGTVWVGTDTYPPATLDYELRQVWPDQHRALIQTDQIAAALKPGTTFLDQRVVLVRHALDEDDLSTTVYFERAGSRSGSPSLDAIRAIVQHETREQSYHRRYPAKVVGQHEDGSIDVVPDDADLPPMTGLQIRTLAPGVRVLVDAGTRVGLMFEGGDPSLPVATLFESDASGPWPVATENSTVCEHYHDLGGATAYAGPFPVAGLSKSLGAVTFPVQPLAASPVKISPGSGHQNVRFPA